LLLSNGRIGAIGTVEDVLTPDNIRSVYGVDVLLDKNPVSLRPRVTTIFN
jgi:ABC-type hemin transport system ATPase subunit